MVPKRLWCVIVAMAAAVHPLLASDTPSDRATLKGVKSVFVLVENLGPEVQRDGLTLDQLQTDAELRLRQSGINVVTASDKSDGYLYIHINTLKGASGLYAYNASVSFQHLVIVLGNQAWATAETWSTALIATVGVNNFPRSARGTVDDQVDKFINAYLSVNPKPRP